MVGSWWTFARPINICDGNGEHDDRIHSMTATKTFKLGMDDISQALGQYLVDEGKLSEGVEGGTITFDGPDENGVFTVEVGSSEAVTLTVN